MTRDRLATRKWKVPSDISESKSMMRLPSLSKSKSEVFGQSGHCSARLLAALRATSRYMQCSKSRNGSFDDLIGAGKERERHFDAKSGRRLEVDRQVKFGRLHHRQIRGLFAFEDPAGIDR